MIKLLDDIALLEDVAKAQPYFGSVFIADATAFIDDPELMSIWVECDEHGKAHTAVNLSTDSVTICTSGGIPGMESMFFMTKLLENKSIKTLICDEPSYSVLKGILPIGEAEPAVQMECKNRIDMPKSDFEVRTSENVDDVARVMAAAFGEKDRDSLEIWKLRMVRGVRRGQVTLFTLYENGRAVSTATVRGRTKTAGSIASVVTLPKYRNRGYASYLTALCSNMLLDEHRRAWLVPANAQVKKMYEKLGFKTEKTCYYIEINSEED